MKQALVLSGPIEVPSRLKELALTESVLRLAVEQGQAQWANLTLNYPPMYRGVTPWASAIAVLREQKIPDGWERLDEGGQSLAVNSAGTIAVTAATGDRFTGIKDATPSTKSGKGPKTQLAITQNTLAVSLFGDIRTAERKKADARITWILLFHRDTDSSEIRCELSLPARMNDEGQVDEWVERIILNAIPFGDGGAKVEFDAPEGQSPNIDFNVKRRA